MKTFQLHEKAQIIFKKETYTFEKIRKEMDGYKSALCGIQSAAVVLDRTAELLILLMAMLEAGITFLPLEYNAATDRLNYMLHDSDVEAVITNEKYESKLKHSNKKILEAIVRNDLSNATASSGNEKAYILYTSGSTGNPKGVIIPRSALKNFMEGVSNLIPFTPEKRIACLTTISFDIFILESIMALCKGLTVVLADEEEQKNPRLMARLIIENKVDILQMTPSRMQLLFHHNKTLDFLRYVQIIMIGGETFPLEMLNQLQKHTKAKIYNMYGPTETTIWSCIADLTKSKFINVGFPIQNTEIFILDDNHKIVQNGTIGEIAISGAGLALGYINLNSLTKEKFTYLTEIEKQVYLTGDLGKILPDHSLQYVGRVDNQIKLRGHRIELEEIESTLNGFSEIQQSIVVVENGELTNNLIAFYTGKKNLEKQNLISFIERKLPDYMVPSRFIYMTQFPLTANGKIDRKQLLVMCSCQNENSQIHNDNNSGVADKVIALISDMTGQKNNKLSGSTTLTELGLDSITFIKLIVNLEEMFDFEFDDNMLLFTAYPNIQTMIDYVDENRNND